jgi:hypothetical protein
LLEGGGFSFHPSFHHHARTAASGDSLYGCSALAAAGKPFWFPPVQSKRFIATAAVNAGMAFFGRSQLSQARDGAKPPLADAWAGADARCPIRWPPPLGTEDDTRPGGCGMGCHRHLVVRPANVADLSEALVLC